MGRQRASLFACSLFCAAAMLTAGEPTTDELIRQLGDETFKVREDASRALCERAGELWDTLQQASRQSDDPEVRNRLQQALAAPTQRLLSKALAEAARQIEALDKQTEQDRQKIAEESAAANKTELAESEKAQKLEAELAKMAATPEREAAAKKLEAAKQAMDAAAEKVAKLKLKVDEVYTQFRLKRDRLKTREDQIRHVIDCGDVLGRNPPAEWSPALLPFARRLKLPVTFEFNDTPLREALKRVSELSGATFELGAGTAADDTPITLRVTDMPVLLAAEWVARLAELEVRTEESKVVVEPRRNPADAGAE
jgi:chemotaxis protein histidine kinase CheA